SGVLKVLWCGLLTIVLTQSDAKWSIVALGQNTNNLSSIESQRALVDLYCVGCHNDKLKSGGFSWTALDLSHPDQNVELAEKVIHKLRAGMMPPAGARRPDPAAAKALAAALETRIDQAADARHNAHPPELHRLN